MAARVYAAAEDAGGPRAGSGPLGFFPALLPTLLAPLLLALFLSLFVSLFAALFVPLLAALFLSRLFALLAPTAALAFALAAVFVAASAPLLAHVPLLPVCFVRSSLDSTRGVLGAIFGPANLGRVKFSEVHELGVLGTSRPLVPRVPRKRRQSWPMLGIAPSPRGAYDAFVAHEQTGGTGIALILFVEHHDAFRQSATILMDREDDLEVVSQANSVAEGREKMAEGGIDAAIVDVPLPDEGAAAMVGELHDANPSIPVLVMTRAEDPEVRERFLKAGAREVLSKGNTFAEVLAAVRRLGDEA